MDNPNTSMFSSNLDEYLRSDDYFNAPDADKPIKAEAYRKNFIEDNNITSEDDLNIINDKAKEKVDYFRSITNTPRFIPSQEQRSDLYLPKPVPTGDKENDIASIEKWRDDSLANAAKILPAQKEDLGYDVENLANSLIRDKAAEGDYGNGIVGDFMEDKAARVWEGLAKPFFDLADKKDSDRYYAKNWTESPEHDQDIASQFAQGIGQLVGQTIISAGLITAGQPELIAPTFGVLYGAQYFNEGYTQEMERTGNSQLAVERGISQLPAAALDTFSDAFLFRTLGKESSFVKQYIKAATDEEKKAILKEAIPSITHEMKIQFLSEGLIGGAGADVASNIGNYYITGDEKYLENSKDLGALAKSAFVEGTLGAVFGAGFAAYGKGKAQQSAAHQLSAIQEEKTAKASEILNALKAKDYNKVLDLTGKTIDESSVDQAFKDYEEELKAARAKPDTTLEPSDTTGKPQVPSDVSARIQARAGKSSYEVTLQNHVNDVNEKLDELKKDPTTNADEIKRLESQLENIKNSPDLSTTNTFQTETTTDNIAVKDDTKDFKPTDKIAVVDGNDVKDNDVVYLDKNSANALLNQKRKHAAANGNPVPLAVNKSRTVIGLGNSSNVNERIGYTSSVTPKPGMVAVRIKNAIDGNNVTQHVEFLGEVTEVKDTKKESGKESMDREEFSKLSERVSNDSENFKDEEKRIVYADNEELNRAKKDAENLIIELEKDKSKTKDETELQGYEDSIKFVSDHLVDLNSITTRVTPDDIINTATKLGVEPPQSVVDNKIDVTTVDNTEQQVPEQPKPKKTRVKKPKATVAQVVETPADTEQKSEFKPKNKTKTKVKSETVNEKLKQVRLSEEEIALGVKALNNLSVEQLEIEKKKHIDNPSSTSDHAIEIINKIIEEKVAEQSKEAAKFTVEEELKRANDTLNTLEDKLKNSTTEDEKARLNKNIEIVKNNIAKLNEQSKPKAVKTTETDATKEGEDFPIQPNESETSKQSFIPIKENLDNAKTNAEAKKLGIAPHIYRGLLERRNSATEEQRSKQTNWITKLAEKLGYPIDKIKIFQNSDHLSDVRMDTEGRVDMSNGEIEIFLDQIYPKAKESLQDATERVLKHEVLGHIKIDGVLQNISKEGYNKLVKYLKTLKLNDGTNLWKHIQKVYSDTDEKLVFDEVLAHIAQTYPIEGKGLLEKIKEWITTNFDKLFKGQKEWTADDLNNLINRAINIKFEDIAKNGGEKFRLSIADDLVNSKDVANLTLKGAYGAWIDKSGNMLPVYGEANDFPHLTSAAKILRMKEDDMISLYTEMYKRGWIRAVNQYGDIYIEGPRISNSHKNTLEMIGINDEKSVIWQNGLSEKYIYSNKEDSQFKMRYSKADTYGENFKSWFGDWEKSPKEASKVVDEKGEPLVVYHGTAIKKGITVRPNPENNGYKIYEPFTMGDDFNIFYPLSHFGTSESANDRLKSAYDMGIHSSKNDSHRIYPVYLNIRNPLEMTDNGQGHMYHNFAQEVVNQGLISREDADKFTRDFVQDLIKKGIASNEPSDNSERAAIALIKHLGFDGFKYVNNIEDKGSISWVALYPNQVKSATGNTGEYNKGNPDIRYSKADTLSESEIGQDNKNTTLTDEQQLRYSKASDEQTDDFVMHDEARGDRAVNQEIRDLGKRKIEAPLVIDEKGALDALKSVKFTFLNKDDKIEFLKVMRNFVETRSKVKDPKAIRESINELNIVIAEFNKASAVEEFKQLQEIIGDTHSLGKLSDYEDGIDQVRALVTEIITDSENKFKADPTDVSYENYKQKVAELQVDLLDMVDDSSSPLYNLINETRDSLVQSNHPILAKGLDFVNRQLGRVEKVLHQYMLNLLAQDPDSLSKKDARMVYYDLMSMVHDGYPSRIKEFISDASRAILNSEERFRTPYTGRIDKALVKVETLATKLRRLATDSSSSDSLNKLLSPIREGIMEAERFHDEVHTPFLVDATKRANGQAWTSQHRRAIGVFSKLRQSSTLESPKEALLKNILQLQQSNKEQLKNYDPDVKKAGQQNSDILNHFIEGMDLKNLSDDDMLAIEERAINILGQESVNYLNDVESLFDVVKPLSRLTTQFVYSRSFEEINHYVPSMSIAINGAEIDVSAIQLLSDAEAIRKNGADKTINKTGMASTYARNKQLKSGHVMVLDINHLADSVGRLNTLDYFTALPRMEIGTILDPKTVYGKQFNRYMNDDGGQFKSELVREAVTTMWQNQLIRASYLHEYHAIANWFTRKWMGSVLSGFHQFVNQTITNTIPYFVKHITNPQGIADYGKALSMLAQYKSGRLDARQTHLFDTLLSEIRNRHQDAFLDKGVALHSGGIVEMLKEKAPAMYKAIKGTDNFIEKALMTQFKLSDIASGAPMLIAEYFAAERARLGDSLRMEDMVWNPVSHFKATDEAERFIGIGSISRRGEFLTNRNPGISLARNLLMAFRSFTINNATNFNVERKRFFDSDLSNDEKIKSLKYMIGISAQSAAFQAIKVGIAIALGNAIKSALKHPEDDDKLKALYRRSAGQLDDKQRRLIDAEIAMRQSFRDSFRRINERNDSTRLLGINIAKDVFSNMFVTQSLTPFMPDLILHNSADAYGEEQFKQVKDGEEARLNKIIKRQKNLGNEPAVAFFKEQLDDLMSQQYLPAAFEEKSITRLGGSFGGALKGAEAALDASSSMIFKQKDMSAKDLMALTSVLGLGQPDIKRFLTVVDRLDQAEKKRNENIKKIYEKKAQ